MYMYMCMYMDMYIDMYMDMSMYMYYQHSPSLRTATQAATGCHHHTHT